MIKKSLKFNKGLKNFVILLMFYNKPFEFNEG